VVVFAVLVGGTASLMVSTPLREYIPGYFRPEYRENMVQLQSELNELKRAVQNQEAVMPALQPLSDEKGKPNSPANTQANNAISAIKANTPDEAPAGQPAAAYQQASPVAKRNPMTYNAVRVANTAPLLSLFSPVRGSTSRGFSALAGHYGTDIIAPENSLISSAIDGVVVFSDFSDRDGYIIGVAGSNNIVTFYKHNSRILKQVGSYVQAGEPIAIIGNTGENTTGTHLHFEVWLGGKPVDPATFLQ